MVTLAHSLALVVKGDQSNTTVDTDLLLPGDDIDTSRENDEQNSSEFDISDPLQVAGAILIGIDMPMPMPIIVTAFNAVCISVIVYIVSEMIRQWVPFI